jgi:hypothetical protein
MPTIPCKNDSACDLVACGSACTCHGVAAKCMKDKGVCGSTTADLCYTGHSGSTAANETMVTGGVQLFVNMQTSVVGFVAIEVVANDAKAELVYSLAEADLLKGSATNAVASWGGGRVASLSHFAGQEISLKVTVADAKLFSLRLGCA